MILEVPNPVQSKPNFERRRSFAVGSKKEGFRSGTKESYFNQNIISLAPGADIQQAIDTVYATGGGKVVLLNGTHIVEADIEIPSGVILEGETFLTTVDFNSTPHGFIMSGVAHSYSGTIAVTNNSTVVTGTGTAFDGDLVGLALFIDGAWNYVASVESSTSLTLDSEYVGPALSGVSIVAADTNYSATIHRLNVQNSTGTALTSEYAYGPLLNDFFVFDCEIGIYTNYVEFLLSNSMNVFTATTGVSFNETYSASLLSFGIANCSANGMEWNNSGDSSIYDFGITGCLGNGLQMTNCDALTASSFTVSDNTGNGIELVSTSDDNQFFGGKVNRNGGSGVKLTATSDRNAMIGLSCDSNTSYGINIAAASCDNNMVSSCALVSNTAGQLNNAGTGTKARGIIGNVDIG